MNECNHLVGFTRTSVLDPKTGNILATWLEECRADAYKHYVTYPADGYRFKFCPECGVDISDLPHGYYTADSGWVGGRAADCEIKGGSAPTVTAK